MKWLLIILLIINVCYFGWELNRQTKIQINNTVKQFNVNSETKKLHIVLEDDSTTVTTTNNEQRNLKQRELYTSPNTFDQKLPALENFTQKIIGTFSQVTAKLFEPPNDPAQQVKTIQNQCFSFGPFTDPYQVSMLSHWFKENDIHAKKRSAITAQENTKYFWVYLGLPVAQEQTLDIIEILKKQNITDYKIIHTKKEQSAISLGIFSRLKTAEKRLQKIEDIGYHPIIADYYKTTEDIWIDIKIDIYHTDEKLYLLLNNYPANFDSVPKKCADIFPA